MQRPAPGRMQTVLTSLDARSRQQVLTLMSRLGEALGPDLLALYLHGSAVAQGLRPNSDVDLLGVLKRSLTEKQRRALLSSLLDLSASYPAPPGGPRCLEVIFFAKPDLAGLRFHAQADFVYGEWLRDGFRAGRLPTPERDAEYTLILAQARQEALPLIGPEANALLPEVKADAIRAAMGDLLPGLLSALQDDTRNVLLTLARMWRTARTGDFLSKDRAAVWAIRQLASADAEMLDHARRAYLGEAVDDWRGHYDIAHDLAQRLADEVKAAL